MQYPATPQSESRESQPASFEGTILLSQIQNMIPRSRVFNPVSIRFLCLFISHWATALIGLGMDEPNRNQELAWAASIATASEDVLAILERHPANRLTTRHLWQHLTPSNNKTSINALEPEQFQACPPAFPSFSNLAQRSEASLLRESNSPKVQEPLLFEYPTIRNP